MAESDQRGAKRRGAWRPGLSRLLRDRHGNVLAIVGASLVPLLAMVGSGVDLTRAYMAQARLQQACDAAALAGRRVMSGGVVDGTVTAEATKFFNFNFPQETWNTAKFTPAISQGADSTVVITASTTLKTEIMRLFGFVTLPISVSCNAKQDFVNTDIVLVLDTTGSMNFDVAGNDVGGGPTSRIVALRKAVLALYDELSSVQTKLEAAGLRLRYSVVPFSSGINVGPAIMSVNPAYMASDTWTYQSRQANYRHVDTKVTYASCNAVSGNWTYTNTSNGTYQGTCTYTNNDSSNGTATGGFRYAPIAWDISDYVAGKTVPTPSRSATSNDKSTWAGCIEERKTTSAITASSGYTIPAEAYDLNIDMVPTSDIATQWKPYWPEVAYRPDTGSQPQLACPVAATRLKAWTRAQMSAYLDTLSPTGGTYHDNGMIWGARFISQGGIFAADNPKTFGNMPVSRQIIYMTDGIIDTGPTLYSTYGMEYWDKRVTGGYSTDADSDARHDQRFKMMCAATKQMGVSIWVIAFASALSSSLTECATSPAQASTSADSASLTAKFVEIGKSIGALRLTQ